MLFVLLFVLLWCSISFSQNKECVWSFGYGEGVNKKEALKSAQEDAIINALGAKIKTEIFSQKIKKEKTISRKYYEVSNQELKGEIAKFIIIEEEQNQNIVKVKIKACVIPFSTKQNKVSDKDKIFLRIVTPHKKYINILQAKLERKLIGAGFSLLSSNKKNLDNKSIIFMYADFNYSIIDKPKENLEEGFFYIIESFLNIKVEKNSSLIFSKDFSVIVPALSIEEAVYTAIENLTNQFIVEFVDSVLEKKTIAFIKFENVSSMKITLSLQKELYKIPFISSVEIIRSGYFKILYQNDKDLLIESIQNVLGSRLIKQKNTEILFRLGY